ncbi:DNA pilot protein [Peromfec virus RodF7_5]|uniref:DNA pilot protein n=1 Tax=Peromfec virus RodF7_5 TaxID=2929354 RepID=A0A976R7U0_9VIRU|nr:DNA pilot protein [Peromfec virus RodF7_5]
MSDRPNSFGGSAVGALGQIGSSVLGSVFNAHQQDKAFEQSVELWKMNNEYNKPINQKKRLLEAGINPYMAMTGDSGSQIASAPSPAQADTAGAGAGFQTIGDYFAREQQFQNDTELAKADTALKNEETNGLKIDNATKGAKNVAEIEDIKEDTKSKKAKRTLDEWQNTINLLIQDDVVKSYSLSNDLAQSNIDLNKARKVAEDLNNELQRLNIKNAPAKFAAELALMAAQTNLAYAQENLSGKQAELAQKQAEHEIEKKAKTISETNGVRWDNRTKAMILPYLVGNERNKYYETEQFGDDTTRQLRAFGNVGRKLPLGNFIFN